MRLIETKQLAKESRSSALYVTLSHRWGSAKFTRLLKKNKDDFLNEIPFDVLPQTFKDAIDLATKLERDRIRYIWIDSLCIVQDGKCER